ncbi:MAG: TIGR00730 family Rossman fold protein [Ignavibacteriae bacterium]|nr:TIGR00730 family Rossman fold protein [Ignavibacteriota bacterium]NOG96767.1 TIGR00730 family Rossman fold protein [Ignavibacteriota bacterium]
MNIEKKLMSSQQDLWRVFRIMAEFVEGFELMSNIKPSIAVFGSARTKEENKYYKLGVEVGKELAKKGFGVITGGGPGIMQAANQGANEAGGSSTGVNIDLPHEQSANPFVDHDKLLSFRYFFVRKVMFFKYAQGYILLPGGFGTIDECFEVLTLIQTGKTAKFPVILMGNDYWKSLIAWVKKNLLEGEYISEKDLDLFQLTDDPVKAADIISDFHKGKEFTPNF